MSVTSEAKKIADQTPAVSAPAKPQNVVEALARVMSELPAIGKHSQAAAQQGGYAYRGIEAITSEAQSLFGKYGVVFVPRVIHSEIKDIVVAGKPWTDTILSVEYDVFGPSHGTRTMEHVGTSAVDMITVGPLLAIGRDNSDKGANKAMTQAYKYALLQVLCISDKKDDGDQASHEADARPVPPPVDAEAEEAMHTLVGLIGEIDEAERDIVKSHLHGRFGSPSRMNLGQIREATAVVIGWPETAKEGS